MRSSSRLRSVEEYLYLHATNTPDKVALVVGERQISYRSLYEKAYRYHEALKASGVSAGDIVVTRADQTPDYVVIYLAIHMAGGIVTSLEKNIPLAELEKIASRLGASFVIPKENEVPAGPWKNLVSPSQVPSGEDYPALPSLEFPDPEASADILFTTGTTGASKGVELSHKALVATAENLIFGCEYKPDTFLIVPGPLNHANAIRKLLATLVNGSTLCLLPGMSDLPGFFRALDHPLGRKACCLPPAAIRTLFALTGDRLGAYSGKIDFIESASAPLPESDKERLRRLLPDARLYNNYGSSEAASVCMVDYNRYPDKKDCIGKEMPNSRVIIVDDAHREIPSDPAHPGFLACLGDVIMKGYVRDPALTQEVLVNGAVYTSDIGYKDAEGFLFITGRKGDVINVGGIKVSPVEVEEAALAFEGVEDCICIARPDPITGQALKLLLVLRPGISPDFRLIGQFLSARLEAVKVPRFYEQVEKIERTYNGKPDRKFYR